MIVSILLIIALGLLARPAIDKFSATRVATGLTETADGKAMLKGCDGLQNCTSSTATDKKSMVEPYSYSIGQGEVMDKMAEIISNQTGANVISVTPNYLHATFKTKLLGYTDDFELLLDESDGTLNVRSASRIGKSDLGANRKRIEALRQGVP